MKRFSFTTVIGVLAIFSALLIGQIIVPNAQAQKPTEEVIKNTSTPFDKLWDKVEELQGKGLYASALEQVEVILSKAREEKNHPQYLKGQIHKIKYNGYIKEDDYVLAIQELDSLAQIAETPLKQVTHSMIAELYWGYFQSHRYQFYDRTEILGEKPEDMRKWDLRTMAEAVRDHYLMSLDGAEPLKNIPISDYDAVIKNIYDYNEKRWPTLYDFIANRAIDFFSSAEFDVTRPAETFEINDIRYFSSPSLFTKIDIETKDSLSTSFYTIKLLQELTAYHLSENNVSPLLDLELKRLSIVKDLSVHEKKDSLYLMALQVLSEEYPDNEITAEVYAEIADWHRNKGNTFNQTRDSSYQKELIVAHKIASKTIEDFPDTKGSKLCENIIIDLEYKQISFEQEFTFNPGQKNLVKINYKNVDKVYARLLKIDFEKWKKEHQNTSADYYNYLVDVEPMKSWSIELDDRDDYQPHATEVLVPELDKGHYVLLLSSSEQFEVQNDIALFDQNIWVTNFSANIRNYRHQSDVIVMNKMSGKSLENIEVKVYEDKYDYKSRSYITRVVASGKTDDKGIFSFKSQDYSNSYYYSFKSDDDYYYHNNRQYSYSYYYEEEPREITNIFTDRAIYRPGQTIHFKGIVAKGTKNDFELQTNKSMVVNFYDVNYQLVEKQTLKTNEYGSFSGSFQIPMGLLNGSMRITTSSGTKYVQVEEYKRPKFEVEMDPLKGEFRVNDEITAKGKAIAYAGNVIDGAKVQYTVTRTTRYSYYWYWMPYQTSSKVIKNGTTTTDENGAFDVVFDAIPDLSFKKKYRPIFTYQIQADVTDINGETHSTSSYVNVGYHNLSLNLSVYSVTDKANDSIKGTIGANNLNGEPLEVGGTITLYKLKYPKKFKVDRYWDAPDVKNIEKSTFEADLPYLAYSDDYNNEKKWEREKVQSWDFNTAKTTDWKVPMQKNWPAGKYIAVIEAKDNLGETVKSETSIELFDLNGKQSPTADLLWIKNDQPEYEPGDTAHILFASGANLDQVLVSYEHQGKIIKEEMVALNKEQKSIDLPIEEKHRGGIQIHFYTQKYGRAKHLTSNVYVPFKNKNLDVEFATFRDKLRPGQEEEWTVTIKGNKGEKLAAEFMATMYDASLDAFASNGFYMNFFSNYYAEINWGSAIVDQSISNRSYSYYWNKRTVPVSISYPYLNWYGHNISYYRYYNNYRTRGGEGNTYAFSGAVADEVALEEAESDDRADMDALVANTEKSKDMAKKEAPAPGTFKVNSKVMEDKNGETIALAGGRAEGQKQLDNVEIRKNFNETAFFFPQLKTNDKGEVVFSFTVPESLTKWKFLGMAHTKDLASGTLMKETVTQKDLMLFPNAPRFFRENDEMYFSAKISNVSDKKLSGDVRLQLLDPITEEVISSDFKIDDATQKFEVEAGKSTAHQWKIRIPEKYSTVAYRIVASSKNFSDGEEKPLPVLSNRMMVTESLPLPIKGGQSKTYTFDKLMNNNSSTLKHHALTLEYTANPAWYAVQALPYMMEYPYECAEQTFSRLYANAIASHIVNSKPEIQKVFEEWKNSSPEAFLSNLEKNQELKSLLLEETPWVMDAKDESQRKRRIALLFDMNKMRYELTKAKKKLKDLQTSNGGWAWFKGMRDNRYITQHITAGFGHLKNLGINDYNVIDMNMLRKAVDYLDDRIKEDYDYLKRYASDMDEMHISYHHVHYLYTRSFFDEFPIQKKHKEAIEYYRGQAEKYWTKFNLYAEGMIGLAAHRNDNDKLAKGVLQSLKERSLSDEEMGIYWKEYKNGFYWYQAPIETQALMIEFFEEVGDDEGFVDELRIWLLKQKQTQDWKTTKATAEACYALLLRGTEWLEADPVDITIGDVKIVYNTEAGPNERAVTTQAGTGYFKTKWAGSEVKENMGKVQLEKKDKGVAWGALYWQYFEQLDKITPHETPLKISKTMNKVVKTMTGEKLEKVTENNLQIGDRVRVRIEIEVDRKMEFVHLKDMRAATFEPVQVISSYQYQDGLGYYQSTKDASTNFFFDHLPKGVYVFEYDLIATIKGDFSNGISTMQCMYAPEFSSHSEGIRIKVK